MMHSLVTGGAGFIGSHLVDALVARGDRVSVLDNLSSGSLDFLAGVRGSIEFHELDLLDEDFDAHLADVDIIWHLSANPEVRTGIDAGLRYIKRKFQACCQRTPFCVVVHIAFPGMEGQRTRMCQHTVVMPFGILDRARGARVSN